MKNIEDMYITLRKAIKNKLLQEKDCVYVAYLLTIIIKKMIFESEGGGHFNINPDTVLVLKKENEDVKVKLLDDDCPHKPSNGKPDFDTGGINPCFCAPESFLGKFSSASDVYSIGCLLAYMLQGRYVYNIDESMPKNTILKIIKESNPDLDITDDISNIVKKAISKGVGSRYKSVDEMGFVFMDYLGIEKPKVFSCFSADDRKNNNGTSFTSTPTDNDDMKDLRKKGSEAELDVEIKVRVGDGFKDVAGMEDVKKILRRDFVEIVSHRELAKQYGIMPSNMLFYGAPGTGKTFISMKLAEETGLAFCSIKPSDLGSIWIHGTVGKVQELFKMAENKAKNNKKGCILLIDEIDALCGVRDARGNEHQADEVAEWLTQLNDCVEKNVFVIGTTNCIDRIDKAIIRHGRIDQVIYVGMPDMECRKQLFEIELEKRPHEADIDIDDLARLTDGYTSSDISFIVKETARLAFEASIKNDDDSVVNISESMLRDVIKSTRPSVSHEDVRKYERMRDEYIRNSKPERPRIGFMA